MLRKGLPLESALDGATGDLKKPEDRGFAHAIAAEVLRRLPDLDALIDRATPRRLPDDAKARFALRIALVQALRMGTPPHAAISTALPLVDGGPRRLVHGVFGTVMRKGWTLPETATLPAAVAGRWRKAWGDDLVVAAERQISGPPPIDLTLRDKHVVPAIDGISLRPGHLRVPAGTTVSGLPGYQEGQFWVQDISAATPARMLERGDGRTVLDLCAAPGGKTMQLASAGWRVTALDVSKSRLARLSENLARTGLEAEVIAADVMTWAPPAPVDAILLDAPCSATGIYRRHPDVLHRARPAVIAELADAQKAMLLRVADWLKPGGTLVYAVCSLEPEEGEAVAEHLLGQRPDYQAFPPPSPELPFAGESDAPRFLRCYPGAFAEAGGADGFFIARFTRRDAS